ncbi:MAG: PilW family protein [Burkholderiaceae bacterium]|nr:PilW family protein [Burkholderiaceae bacterium]
MIGRLPPRAARAQRGITLVELMVGVAIGLFLVAVMGAMFLGSKGDLRSQNQGARLQENARFAVDVLSADLRMAGYRGCRGSGGVTNTLNTPTAHLYHFAQGLWASRHTGSAWSPALPAALGSPALSPVPASAGDVLTVRRSVGPGIALIAEMGSGSAALSVTPGVTLAKGDWLMVSDCSGAAILQATNDTPGVLGTIEHSAAVTLTPGVSTGDLGRPFLQDALVHRLATVTYYLAPSARSGKTHLRALWSYTVPSYDGSTQPQELMAGVERMAVRLGVDASPAAGDGTVDAWVTPDEVTDWGRVVTAQVELLLASTDDQVTTVAQPYVFGGSTVTPTDRRLRRVVTVSASLRNALR